MDMSLLQAEVVDGIDAPWQLLLPSSEPVELAAHRVIVVDQIAVLVTNLKVKCSANMLLLADHLPLEDFLRKVERASSDWEQLHHVLLGLGSVREEAVQVWQHPSHAEPWQIQVLHFFRLEIVFQFFIWVFYGI